MGKTPLTNTTDVTDTTAQDIIPAPSTSSFQIVIEAITVTNKTTGENPIVIVQDTSDTPLVIDTFAMGDIGDSGGDHGSVCRGPAHYGTGRRVTPGKGVKARATSSVGDCLVTIQYRIEPVVGGN